MKFGQQQYQHRFYQDKPLNKKSNIYVSNNGVLPSINYRSSIIDRSFDNQRLNKSINFDRYALSNSAISEEHNQYLQNAEMIDYFRLQAEYLKKRKSMMHRQINHYPMRILTQPVSLQSFDRSLSSIHNYRSRQLPDLINKINLQNLVLKQKVISLQHQREQIRKQAHQQQQLQRKYKYKYDKLKSRIKQEVNYRRILAAQQRKKRQIEMQIQTKKYQDIENKIHSLSSELEQNATILNENLRLRKQLSKINVQSEIIIPFPKVPLVLQPQKNKINPKVQYKYLQLQRLKKDISKINRKLQKSKLF